MIRLLTGILFLIVMILPAQATKRVALVIGNSNYEHAPQLANPANDAADISGRLKALGFTVIEGRDLTLSSMRDKVREFMGTLSEADIGLFYYAGHGLQVNGKNYLAPVDAQLITYDDLEFEALPIGLVLSAMERKTRTNLLFLDACRNNPLARNLARSMGTRSTDVGRGLARISSGVGSLISFSTQPGNVALDGTGRNSPFTAALLKHIGTPGEDITRSLRKVRSDVLEATNGKQVPWENSSLTGDVILREMAKSAETRPDENEATAELRKQIAEMQLQLQHAQKQLGETKNKEVKTGRLSPNNAPTDVMVHSLLNSQDSLSNGKNVKPVMFLYEERLGQQQPKVERGTLIWEVVQEPPGNNQPPEPAIEAKINLPETGISAIMTIKRNANMALPASHLIEIVFALSDQFEGSGISAIQNFAMKHNEQDTGDSLIAVPAKITDSFFMIALNDYVEAVDVNLKLLRERNWIDLPFNYGNGRRALLTLEKGFSGEEVFNQVLMSWEERMAEK